MRSRSAKAGLHFIGNAQSAGRANMLVSVL